MSTPSQRVSRVWAVAAIVAFAAALLAGAASVRHQQVVGRPLGEGDLFRQDADRAVVIALDDPSETARRIRNALDIELVAIVDSAGRIAEATSTTLIGRQVAGFLGGMHGRQAFGAIAAPVDVPIAIDGVEEWPAGSTLYEVIAPLGDGRSVVLGYDVAELLERRRSTSGVLAATIQLGGVALAAVIVGFLLVLGRAGASRRLAVATREHELAVARERELRDHNRDLEAARHRAEEALALAEEKNRIRSEFVLMINHELRTPLTSLLTGTELLASGAIPDDETRSVLTDMAGDGQQLLALIDGLLAVARIENRGLDYRLRPTATSELAERIETLASVDKLVLHDDATVHTDREGVIALVGSLADNALQHGASTVTVEIGATRPMTVITATGTPPPRAVEIDVVDDGPGIAPDFAHRIFEKFEKDSFSSGTGLGMYIARLMADAMGGCISVSSGPTGSTFRLSLPIEGNNP